MFGEEFVGFSSCAFDTHEEEGSRGSQRSVDCVMSWQRRAKSLGAAEGLLLQASKYK